MIAPNDRPENYRLTWQELFSAEESRWDDLRRAGRILVPPMGLLVIAMLWSIFYISIRRDTLVSQNGLISILVIFSLVALPVTVFLIGVTGLLKLVRNFFVAFYCPPSDAKVNLLIRKRWIGIPPVPSMLSNLISYPFILFKEPRLDENHWARWLGGPALLIVYDGVALYLERGNQFSRVVGPGMPVPLLDRFETIKAVVDLRPRFDIKPINAFTKDGIHVKLIIQIECQVRASHEAQAASSKLIYAFDPVEVKKLVERTVVRFNPDKHMLAESDWIDTVWGRLQGVISSFVYSHRLDQLLVDAEGRTHLESTQVGSTLLSTVNRNLELDGVFIKTMRVVRVEVREDLAEKMMELWKAQKEHGNMIIKGEAEANTLVNMEKARAEASRDVLLVVSRSLQRIGVDNFMQPLLYSLSDFLDQNLDDPVVRSYVGNTTLETLEKFRNLIRQRF